MDVRISESWDRYLEFFPDDKKDIYYTEAYVKLYENDEDHAFCIICESGDKVALMPYLRRSISDRYDFETAYGYGGPIINTDDVIWIGEALKAMKQCFASERYLCGFVRFHPILGNALLCRNEMPVVADRKTICMVLKDDIEDIWMSQISSKNRNMIRKAEKNGLQFRTEYDYASIQEFVRLYYKTMERLQAEEFYYFKDAYFEQYINNFRGKGFLGVVSLNENIVGAALFMTYGKYGHYHLAGSDRNYSGLGINNFLLWNTAIEMKKQGVEIFHLGGGTGPDTDDPLFRFKKAFSNYDNDFSIGKWIFDGSKYDEIASAWEMANPDLIPRFGRRLLKYRYSHKDL